MYVVMKRTLLILMLMLIAAGSHGQKTVVTGILLDSLTRAGEPAAVVAFFRSDVAIGYAMTDEEGRFSQTLQGTGGYRLVFSNIGRKTRTVPFSLQGQATVDLGEILIEDDVQTLEAGSVIAQKNLVVMDVDFYLKKEKYLRRYLKIRL